MPLVVVILLALCVPLVARATTKDTQPETRSNPVIATPEGVKTQFHSGGVGYTYEIDLPPAAGIVPALTLSFSSLTGNTEYGKGWTLNLGKIERSTRTGPPTYGAPSSGSDRFELDGALLAQDPDNTSRFHLEQTDHRRVLYVATTDSWEVTTPDGTKFLYGSRAGASSTLDNLGRQPDLLLARFRWSLDKVIDPRGNWYEIDYAYETYDHPQPSGAPINYAMNNHPAVIRYSYHDSESGGRDRRIVEFQWGARGDDWNDDRPTSYRSGFKIQISERLTNLLVGTDTDGDGDIDDRIRRYEFLYAPKPVWGGDETLPPFSQLVAIQRYGKTDADVFPSRTDFEYSRPSRGHSDGADWSPSNRIEWRHPAEPNGVNFELGAARQVDSSTVSGLLDMNGDGFVDFVETTANGELMVAYGPVADGGAFDDEMTQWGFATPVAWGTAPWMTEITDMLDPTVNITRYATADLTDMNGDGRPDRVESIYDGTLNTIQWRVALNQGDGSFGEFMDWAAPCPALPYVCPSIYVPTDPPEAYPPPWRYAQNISLDHNRPYLTHDTILTRLVDVNGDGRPDHVTGANDGQEFDVTHNDPNLVWVAINNGSGFDSAETMPLQDQESGDFENYLGSILGSAWTAYIFTSEMFADANGDGLADRFTDSCLWPPTQQFSLGDGWQTASRPGQGHHDYGQIAPTSMCDDKWSKDAIIPEIQKGGMTNAAMLDLNGDGINDYFHNLHPARNGDGYPSPQDGTVWFGLGDGTYLTLAAQSVFPVEVTTIAPGIEWNLATTNINRFDAVRMRIAGELTSYGLSDTIDMNGDGLLDQIYYGYDLPGSHYWVWFHPGPEGLLETVTNELGGVTKLKYKPSTWFRDKVAQAQTTGAEGPGTESHPPTVVPASAPQWLLAEITVEDGRTPTQQTQSIEYAELAYDLESREYLGARMAESKDAAGVFTRRFFHQTKELRPRLEFEEVEDPLLGVLRTEKTTWFAGQTVTESASSVPGSWFPEARETRTRLLDPATEDAQTRVVSRDFNPSTGTLWRETEWGPDETLGTADDFRTVNLYEPNFTSWLISYPSQTSEYLGGVLTKNQYLFYDDNSLPQESPEQGLVTQRLISREDMTLREKWDYDAFGNQTQYFDPRAMDVGATTPTRETVYETDFDVFPVLIRNALLHETQFAFETDFGEVAKVLDPNGYQRCWTYDAFGRLKNLGDRQFFVASLVPCNRILTSFVFNSIGVDVTQQHILKSHPGLPYMRSRTFFDGLGRVYHEEGELNPFNFSVTARGWGTRGEQNCETLPFQSSGGSSSVCADVASARIETTYDALLRPKETQRVVAGNPTVEVSRAYSIDDLDGKDGYEQIETRTTFAYPSPDRVVDTGIDPQGRVVAVKEVGGSVTLLERDPKGRIVTIDGPDVDLDGSGLDLNRLSITYNHLDQRTGLSGLWPAGAWEYQYDANGNLSQQTSPAGKTIRFHWDELNRLALKDYTPASTPASPGTEDVVYSYDLGSYGTGRLTNVHNPPMVDASPALPGVDTSISYELRGLVQSKVRNFGGSSAYAFAYTYDRLGRRLNATLPNGKSIISGYYGSILREIRVPSSGGEAGYFVATNVQVHPSGALAQIDYPVVSGGSIYTYEPDTHRLDTISSTANVSPPTVQSFNFAYDLAGNLTTANDLLDDLDQTFTYDGLHRLASASSTGIHNYGALNYGYDAAGNLRMKGPLTLLYEGGPGGPHAVTRVQDPGAPADAIYTYDDDGGLFGRTKDSVSLALLRDQDGRITSIPGVAYYAYDESGERSRKQVSGVTDTLYVDPEYEVDLASSTHKVHFFHGSRRVAIENRTGLGLPGDPGTQQSLQFTFPDFVGSNSVLVRNTGEVQKSFFRPFGEFQQEGGGLTPYLFTDQENDPETGLMYYGARYYDPWVGRFLSHDPALVGDEAGVTFDRIGDDAQNFNAYSYVLNRPTVFVDPDGEAAFVAACAASAACRGAALGALGFVAGAVVNAAVQLGTTGTVNAKDALAAGAGAGALSAAIGVNPALGTKSSTIAKLAAVTGAGASALGDVANGRKPDALGGVLSAGLSAVTAPIGAAVGNFVENVFGAAAGSVAGEVSGAAMAEGAALGVKTVASQFVDAPSETGGAKSRGASGATGDTQQGHQPPADQSAARCAGRRC